MNAESELAFVALGSNLGDSERILRSAMNRIQSLTEAPIASSSLWATPPIDCPPGSPDFINAVVGFKPRTDESPESLLRKLLEIEAEFGLRPRRIPNEPRPLDLDLIAFGIEARNSPELKLPHPRAHERSFVLAPLAELAPGMTLPGQSLPISQLLAERPDASAIRRLD